MPVADGSRVARRLLIIGWDAADWTFADPMLQRGELPNLAGLVRRGLRSDLSTLDPKLSPMLWTTVATGKTADKHGILNFVEPDPSGDGLRLVSSTSRRTRALWNMLTLRGMRVNVVSWYASHPAEPIHGLCVSNLFAQGSPDVNGSWPMAPGAVHPLDQADAVAALRVSPASLGPAQLKPFVPQVQSCTGPEDVRLLKALATHLAQARSVHAASLHAVRQDDWDCTMVFHDMIDAMGHHFMALAPPRLKHVELSLFTHFSGVMSAVYREQDRMLGELLQACGSDTTVMLLSDHGFFNDERRPQMSGVAMTDERAEVEATWHRSTGVLAMAGPGVRRGAQPVAPGLLDIAPTALALLGLPCGQDMDGRVLAGVIETPVPDPITSWDTEPGEAGMHPADLRQDPFEAHAAIQQLIDLGYMQALPSGVAERVAHVKRESQFNLAVVFSTTGRTEQAVPILESLVESHPGNMRFKLSLADALHRGGRHDRCAELARQWLPADEPDQPVRLTLAIALTFMGQMREAAEHVDRLNPTDPDGCAGLGDLCVMQERADAAEKWFRRALAARGRHTRSHVGLAQVALLRNRLEACANHCMDATEIDPLAASAHYLLGVALAWHGDLDNAVRSLELAVALLPNSMAVRQYLRLVHRARGDDAAAAAHDRAPSALSWCGPDPLALMPRPPRAWAAARGLAMD